MGWRVREVSGYRGEGEGKGTVGGDVREGGGNVREREGGWRERRIGWREVRQHRGNLTLQFCPPLPSAASGLCNGYFLLLFCLMSHTRGPA